MTGLGITPLLPWFKASSFFDVARILNPLDNLGHGNEINIVVGLKDLINPVEESVKELGVIL